MSENKEDRDRHLKAYSFSVLRGVMILLESPPGFQFMGRSVYHDTNIDKLSAIWYNSP